MTSILDQLSPHEVGERLRLAREAAKIKQIDASLKMDMARTTLVAIEQGQRRVRMNEVQQFAKLYSTSVNALLRQESVHADIIPRFRKLAENSDPATEAAAKLFNDLIKAEVELENLLGIQRVRNYPPERPILPGDVRAQAEQDAQELRQWLGLGLSPISDIVTMAELQMGMRIFVRRLEGKVSGLFAYDEKIGGCILLNANHPRERRTQSCAHEIGHFIGTRHQPEVLDHEQHENTREERYADAFARAFLTPARAVMQRFKEVTTGSSHLTRRHIIVLAHAFSVSREAMVRRLEELALTKPGTWDWFEANNGITDEQARQVLGDLPSEDKQKADADRPLSLRLNLMAEQAWQQGLISEGQLSRLLHLDRVDVRQMLDRLTIDGGEADAATKLSH